MRHREEHADFPAHRMPDQVDVLQVVFDAILINILDHGSIREFFGMETAAVVAQIERVDFKTLAGVLYGKRFPVVGHAEVAVQDQERLALAFYFGM